MPTPADLQFFEEKREGLEALYHGQWILIYEGQLIGAYDRPDSALAAAGLLCKGRPCLVKYLGDPADLEPPIPR